MRLKRLIVDNFRGISHLDLEFATRSQTTVLVGVNGVGKSTVLDAVALALSYAEKLPNTSRGLLLRPEDIRVGQSTVHVEAFVEFEAADGEHITNSWAIKASIPWPHGFVHDHLTREPGSTKKRVHQFALAYYPVDRSVRGDPPADARDTSPSDFLAKSVDYASFFAWFEDREDLENERIREDRKYSDPELETVRRAIEALLPGFSHLRVRRAKGGDHNRNSRIVVKKGDQEFELGQLSHGERGLLAMTGDIARRLALCSADTDDPRLRPGVVLIDEICLHLHPQWQREVIPRLERTFPNLQFIVTTHSPQVISQLHPDSVRILEGFAVLPTTPPTYGRDTNAILSEVMGVDERPAFARERLHVIADLMDQEKWTEARAALDELAKDLGPHDAEIMRLGTMLHVLSPSEARR